MAGHSKWAQIKHKKALGDAKKGKIFSKLAREIAVAARLGGESPDAKARLKSAVERAKSYGLPKDNIERAIGRAASSKETENLQEFLYEAATPAGVSILIEGITDNRNRTLSEIKQILTRSGGKLAEPGSLSWSFEKIGLLEISAEENKNFRQEELELAIIDSGATDLKILGDSWLIETKFMEREKIREQLENRGLKIKEASHDYKPRNFILLAASEKETVDKLLDELLELEDVRGVYTNLGEN